MIIFKQCVPVAAPNIHKQNLDSFMDKKLQLCRFLHPDIIWKKGFEKRPLEGHQKIIHHKVNIFEAYSLKEQITLFENYSKYRIWIFGISHQFLSSWKCLVTLFDPKLQVFKNSPKLTISAFLMNFCPLKM